MTCRDVNRWLEARAGRTPELDAHLDGCGRCRRAARAHERLVRAGESLRLADVSDRVLRATRLDAARLLDERRVAGTRDAWWAPAWRVSAAAGLAGVLLAGAWIVWPQPETGGRAPVRVASAPRPAPAAPPSEEDIGRRYEAMNGSLQQFHRRYLGDGRVSAIDAWRRQLRVRVATVGGAIERELAPVERARDRRNPEAPADTAPAPAGGVDGNDRSELQESWRLAWVGSGSNPAPQAADRALVPRAGSGRTGA